jgi:hypothetical protein
MKETQIEKLRQIISRTDKSGNEKVDLLLSLFREHSAKILEPYKEYITLLEKAEASALSIASIHHYRVSDDLIKKGQELRDKIKNQELSDNLVCLSKEDFHDLLKQSYVAGSQREYNDHFGKVPNPSPTFEEFKESLKL